MRFLLKAREFIIKSLENNYMNRCKEVNKPYCASMYANLSVSINDFHVIAHLSFTEGPVLAI